MGIMNEYAGKYAGKDIKQTKMMYLEEKIKLMVLFLNILIYFCGIKNDLTVVQTI